LKINSTDNGKQLTAPTRESQSNQFMSEEKTGIMAWDGKRPIYADQVRKLVDVATEYDPQSWNPANVPARKLFSCVECLRDIDVLLQSAGRLKNKVKQRRKIKIILTPLHSLVGGIRDLSNDLETNPDTVNLLPDNARELIPQIRSQLLKISPIGANSLLSATRHQVSAHIDSKLSAEEMRSLLSQASAPQIGLWLHTSISVLSDFNKLPVYFWSCEPNGKDSIRILFKEPFVVTLGLDSLGIANRIINVHMIPQPPRYDVTKLLMQVVKHSKWMFGPKDKRITNFTVDKREESWAKSLNLLPQLSGSEPIKCESSVVPRISLDDKSYMLVPANVPFLVKNLVQRITKPEDLQINQ
jgi:hypothetical protein